MATVALPVAAVRLPHPRGEVTAAALEDPRATEPVALVNRETAALLRLKRDEDARKAIASAAKWRILAFSLASLDQSIAERFAARLLEGELLPENEWNDALILAESSVAGLPKAVRIPRRRSRPQGLKLCRRRMLSSRDPAVSITSNSRLGKRRFRSSRM